MIGGSALGVAMRGASVARRATKMTASAPAKGLQAGVARSQAGEPREPAAPTGRKPTWETARRPRRVPRKEQQLPRNTVQQSPERTARITAARKKSMAGGRTCSHPLGKGLSQATMCRNCPRRK